MRFNKTSKHSHFRYEGLYKINMDYYWNEKNTMKIYEAIYLKNSLIEL